MMSRLNAAYAHFLRNVECEGAFYACPMRGVPSNMRGLLKMETVGLMRPHCIRIRTKSGAELKGFPGAHLLPARTVRIQGAYRSKEIFHTLEISASITRMRKRQDFLIHTSMDRFFQNVDAIIGPDERLLSGAFDRELDYELELAVVLKRAGKTLSTEQARDYIGGYVIFNDVTARDIQRREMSPGCSVLQGHRHLLPADLYRDRG